MVRSPGFEPGSSTWQADVLNQTRLRPPTPSSRPILQTLLKLKSSGLSEGTLSLVNYRLMNITRYSIS